MQFDDAGQNAMFNRRLLTPPDGTWKKSVFKPTAKIMSLKNRGKESAELEKAKAHIIVEIIQYIPNAVLSKTIIKKATGNITVSSFDAGEELAEKTSPFDNYIQIIDGTAELFINDKEYKLNVGDGIIIAAHSKHCFNANVQFKMISTIIKSGYED
jgi:quercetin dioxygenase-like cupin family protein